MNIPDISEEIFYLEQYDKIHIWQLEALNGQ